MNKYRIGIEIAEKNLQLAVVMKQKTGWRLLETATLPVTADNLRQVLQSVRRSLSRAMRQVILSLPAHQVLMKEIHVDSTLTHDEVYQYLQQQAPTLFGKPADYWFLDFEAHQTGFRAVAAPRENMSLWLPLYRNAGFEVYAVDVDVLALARLTHTLENYEPDQPQALVWLKASELVFLVAKNGQLIYTKSTTYSPAQPVITALNPLLQFFSGLYPQHVLNNILLLDENETLPNENLDLKPAALNPMIWHLTKPIQPHEFCSLGLAIYGY